MDDRERRAAERRRWPSKLTTLDASASDDISEDTTADERLAMMWELAVRAWSFSGRELPEYRRSEMPGRVLREDR